MRLNKAMERLVTAYQEDLRSLEELRGRLPDLRRCAQGTQTELRAIPDQTAERAATLRPAKTLTAFLTRIRTNAQTLDIQERLCIVRLLVKEVLVADNTIVIRHSIPVSAPTAADGGPLPPEDRSPCGDQDYLLRSRREGATLRGSQLRCLQGFFNQYARPQVLSDQPEQPLVAHLATHAGHQDVVLDGVEELRQVQIDGDAVAFADVGLYPPQCSMGGASRPTKSPGAILSRRRRTRRARALDGARKAEARFRKPRVEQRPHDLRDGLLDHTIRNRGNPQQSFTSARLRDRDPSYRLGLVATITQGLADRRPARTGKLSEVLDVHPVNPRGTLVGPHPLPCPLQVRAIQDPLHQVVVQGWLRGITPQRISPIRVQQRLRAIHGSALVSHVRPFAASPFRGETATTASADFCLITPNVAVGGAARVTVGSGGTSSAFALALRPAPPGNFCPLRVRW